MSLKLCQCQNTYSDEDSIMKLPFYTFLGPLLRRNRKSINCICAYPVLNFAPYYVGVLGTLGTILSMMDIVRIVKCGPVLPEYLWRERIKSGQVVTPEAERDCKLISLVLSTEYYFFLLVGLLTKNPIFFIPFLILYAVIIFMESVIFFVRGYAEGIDFKKTGIVLSLLMMYNWICVFCTFSRAMTGCDL